MCFSGRVSAAARGNPEKIVEKRGRRVTPAPQNPSPPGFRYRYPATIPTKLPDAIRTLRAYRVLVTTALKSRHRRGYESRHVLRKSFYPDTQSRVSGIGGD